MSNNNSTVVSCGIGFPGALFICFLALKLTHAIDWSWWWITAPLWGSAALSLLGAIVLLVLVVAFGVKELWDR